MLIVKGMRFPIEVILVCSRWYGSIRLDKGSANKAAIGEINANRKMAMVIRQINISIILRNKIIEQ